MIRLVFVSNEAAESVTLGPALRFWIAGDFVRQGPDGAIVATYCHHHWDVQGQHFPSSDCNDRTLIHFEDAAGGPSKDLGPFTRFFSADGVMYADGSLFAKFIEESQLWHCFVSENFWPVMVIKPVAIA
jgi:hypothetical protein